MKEVWKDIKGYEGLYQVSSFGRVKTVYTGKILKGRKDSRGYLRVNLSKDNIKTTKRLHRLVAEAFIPNPENKPQVNHIDEDKSNNMGPNLEWMTATENTNHGTRNKRASKSRSIPIISTNIKTGESREFNSTKECGKQLGLNRGSICSVLKGRYKQTGGYTFKYKEV